VRKRPSFVSPQPKEVSSLDDAQPKRPNPFSIRKNAAGSSEQTPRMKPVGTHVFFGGPVVSAKKKKLRAKKLSMRIIFSSGFFAPRREGFLLV